MSRIYTIVFEGDMLDAPDNPFKVESRWGKPLTIAEGDLIERYEEHIESLASQSRQQVGDAE